MGSYGYHGDDGRKYASTGMGEEYGPHFGAGDVIGAGLHLETQELFFTCVTRISNPRNSLNNNIKASRGSGAVLGVCHES